MNYRSRLSRLENRIKVKCDKSAPSCGYLTPERIQNSRINEKQITAWLNHTCLLDQFVPEVNSDFHRRDAISFWKAMQFLAQCHDKELPPVTAGEAFGIPYEEVA